MSRSTLCMALCALLGLLCSASAFRMPQDLLDLPGDLGIQALQDFFSDSSDGENKRGMRDEKAHFAIRFTVPPHEYDNFIKEWQDLEKDARKDKGNIIYDLKKTMTDDLYFLHYSEWEYGRDLFKHLTSRHWKDFVDYTNDADVKWELQMLKNPDEQEEMRNSRRKVGRKGDTTDQAHVLVKVLVKPHHAEKFIEAWQKTADRTVEEDGNTVYTLRKVASDNYQFYIYGTWDSMQDYKCHVESDHVRDLLDFYKDRDIVYFRSPLYKYGRDRE